MAASNWILYNDGKLATFQKKINFASDTFKVALVTSASNIFDKTLSPARYADITHELSTSGGYTAGGATASSPALSGGGAVDEIDFDTANVSWTGSGGGFTARGAVLYDDSASSKDLIAYCVLDSTPANVTVIAGQQLIVQVANVFGAA